MDSLKKEYIAMRNSGKYNIPFFFKYYRDKGGYVTDINQFSEHFLYGAISHPMLTGAFVRQGEVDRNEVLRHMDTIFNLTVLFNEVGEFVKVVE